MRNEGIIHLGRDYRAHKTNQFPYEKVVQSKTAGIQLSIDKIVVGSDAFGYRARFSRTASW